MKFEFRKSNDEWNRPRDPEPEIRNPQPAGILRKTDFTEVGSDLGNAVWNIENWRLFDFSDLELDSSFDFRASNFDCDTKCVRADSLRTPGK